MKTKEILDKYCKLIAGLLNVKPEDISFFITKIPYSTHITTGLYERLCKFEKKITGIIPIFDENKKQELNDWSEGNYILCCRDRFVSSFELYRMPHCCAILVSCKSFVDTEFRNKRIATTLNTLRQDIGRALGYSLLLCTDVDKNEHQRKLLATNGWKDIYNVINKRTNNRVYLSVINL